MAELVEAERERRDGEKEEEGEGEDLFRKAERSERILILRGELYRGRKSMMEKPVLSYKLFERYACSKGRTA